MVDTAQEVELKRIAAKLTMAVLDNHSGDWDHRMTAEAFRTLYEAVKSST